MTLTAPAIDALKVRDRDGWRIRLELLEKMQNLILLCRDGQIVFINSAGCRWLGFGSPLEIIGLPLTEIFHRDYHELLDLGMEVLTEETMIPVKLVTRHRGDIDVETWIEAVGEPSEGIFLVEGRDITEHLRSARALRSREQRLEGIINTVADGIITIDDKGMIQTFNPAAERIFHFQSTEVVGRNIRSLIPTPTDPLDDHWPRALTMGSELVGRRKDGHEFPLEIAVREMEMAGSVSYTSVVRDISARKRAEDQMRRLAQHDQLTGLPNRYLFGDRLQSAIALARRHGQKLAVAFVDLDRFKPVNDTYGHKVGDQVLIGIARLLESQLRETDTVARVGGDEFVVILNEVHGPDDAVLLARRMMAAVRTPIEVEGHAHQLGASIGIALFPDHAGGLEELLHLADQAMYRAKAERNDVFCLHGDPALHRVDQAEATP